jgi:hypothetical protein
MAVPIDWRASCGGDADAGLEADFGVPNNLV